MCLIIEKRRGPPLNEERMADDKVESSRGGNRGLLSSSANESLPPRLGTLSNLARRQTSTRRWRAFRINSTAIDASLAGWEIGRPSEAITKMQAPHVKSSADEALNRARFCAMRLSIGETIVTRDRTNSENVSVG